MRNDDLLAPGTPQEIRLGLSTRCNLRCVYCAVSQLTYRGQDMPAGLRQRATAAILEMHGRFKLKLVHVNGHGETTFMNGWTEACASLLDQGLPLSLTTNLAKKLSPQELETLARMTVLMVSIDSSHADLLKRMRRRVDLDQIIANINGIREASRRLGLNPLPRLRLSCGLYDKNTLMVEDFAKLAVSLEAESVGFWNLTKWNLEAPYDYTDVPEEDRAYALDEMSDADLLQRIEAIHKAVALLREHSIAVHIAGDFVSTLEQRLNHPVSANSRPPAYFRCRGPLALVE